MMTLPTAPSETGKVPPGQCYAAALVMDPNPSQGGSGASLAVVEPPWQWCLVFSPLLWLLW